MGEGGMEINTGVETILAISCTSDTLRTMGCVQYNISVMNQPLPEFDHVPPGRTVLYQTRKCIQFP